MTFTHPVKTALLSYGMSGEVFHGPLLSTHSGFELTKIYERSKDRAKKDYPHVAVVRSLQEILEDDTIELVIVNTPHNTHFDYAAQALRSGKHVVVEKPFTNTVREGQELLMLAKEKKLILSVFQNRRWDGDFMTIQQVIKSGVLGRVVEFKAHYDRYRPQVDHSTWKESSGAGAGILYNLGSHMIDQVLMLFGFPLRVDARIGIQRTGGTSPDFYDIRMEYQDVYVTLKSGYLVREEGPRYTIHGESGSFLKWGIDPQEQALKDKRPPDSKGWGIEEPHKWGVLNTNWNGLSFRGQVETLPGNYLGFYDSIYNAIRSQKVPEVTATEALDVIRIIEMAERSSQERQAIENL